VGAACAAARSEGDASVKRRKACFFETKKQKPLSIGAQPVGLGANGQKSFGSFLQKRTAFFLLLYSIRV
jgi:hypothetical protein